jgi:hypothetical protein
MEGHTISITSGSSRELRTEIYVTSLIDILLCC